MRRTAFAATCASAVAVAYGARWCVRSSTWGAAADEIARTMPGDELLADADIVTTRAITIDTGADAIWPWLVQLGPGRGGAYTYDWIENLLGLDMHSADQILPQFQNLKVGDGFALGKSGPRMRAATVERERALVFASDDGHWVWAFGLYPAGKSTRLVSRNRIGLTGASDLTRRFYRYVMEPASLVMERKMLYGIKRRAEQPAFRSGVATGPGRSPITPRRHLSRSARD